MLFAVTQKITCTFCVSGRRLVNTSPKCTVVSLNAVCGFKMFLNIVYVSKIIN